ncbi:MAG: alpha/beta fold hydrolase [Chloroflexaceae bacterium]
MLNYQPDCAHTTRDVFATDIRGHTYRGFDAGDGHETILFLHGWPDNQSVFRHQYDHFRRKGYRVVRFDWIGHGASDKPSALAHYTIEALANDLAELIARRALGPVHCVAHDYGAVVAWHFVTHYASLLRSYSALSIGHPAAVLRHLSLTGLIKNWFLLFNPLPWAIPLYRMHRGAFFRWAMHQHPDRDHVVQTFLTEPNPFYIQVWEQANPLGSLIRTYGLKRLRQIPRVRVPTLGLWGARDAYAVRGQMEHSQHLVAAPWRFVPLEKLGHWLQLEAPTVVNAHLEAWIVQHGVAAAPASGPHEATPNQ